MTYCRYFDQISDDLMCDLECGECGYSVDMQEVPEYAVLYRNAATYPKWLFDTKDGDFPMTGELPKALFDLAQGGWELKQSLNEEYHILRRFVLA